jgi:hypothetical protein
MYVSSTGTLISPRSYGAILELSPVAPGVFTPTVIHTFKPSDGEDPAGLFTNVGGTLYGFATNGGTANNGTFFSLAPPAF